MRDFTSIAENENSIANSDPDDLVFGNFDMISQISDQQLSFEDIVKKIVIEGASSNANYTGFELVDTFADVQIYNYLQDLLTDTVTLPGGSPREVAQHFSIFIFDAESKSNSNPLVLPIPSILV